MISLLNGTVRSIANERVILEVQGVGYSLLITSATSASLTMGSPAILHTSLVVREDSLTLFGFLDEESKNVFELLQTVSGVGPKVALSILGSLSLEDLARAIAQENVGVIEKVPDDFLTDLLSYLKEFENKSKKDLESLKHIKKILKEDQELLEKLAQ